MTSRRQREIDAAWRTIDSLIVLEEFERLIGRAEQPPKTTAKLPDRARGRCPRTHRPVGMSRADMQARHLEKSADRHTRIELLGRVWDGFELLGRVWDGVDDVLGFTWTFHPSDFATSEQASRFVDFSEEDSFPGNEDDDENAERISIAELAGMRSILGIGEALTGFHWQGRMRTLEV